jgi:CRISPR-associated endonuclease Csn1
MPALQRELEKRYPGIQVLPYYLRARALDEPLEAYELGRALYHLAQRRGFQSNWKDAARAAEMKGKEAEELGKVKGSIEGLAAAMQADGARTLGEYFARLDPEKKRIRNSETEFSHYTSREMYESEFRQIWEAQAPHHEGRLTAALRAALSRAIYYQRPLKDQSRLVGPCELFPKEEKRAAFCTLDAQRMRVLGFVNNLRVEVGLAGESSLTEEQRSALLARCESSERVGFADVRKMPGIGKGTKFTVERGGEKYVPGNITNARLERALGEIWRGMGRDEQERLVGMMADERKYPTSKQLAAALGAEYGFTPALASETAEKVHLPEGYARFSARALRALMPYLEQGLTVEEARKELDPNYRRGGEPLGLLPPVREALPEIRNPAVLRSLTEMRKTVNAIIRAYGKPEEIHIELARELKKTKEDRRKAAKANRDREKLRELAKEELKKFDANRYANPSGGDIEKYLLAMEARWQCPYTQQKYGVCDVFGDHPKVDVEHIIPRSRSLDNTFANKTLAYRGANVEKGQKTPYEWLGEADPDRFERMIETVQGFDGKLFNARAKLRRFTIKATEADELLEEFTERQLQETRYASKLAARYVGLLYGGIVDKEGRTRVLTCAGGVTAALRNLWDLNRILSAEPKKSREDHRHHAVDAIAVALTTRAQVKALADACGDAERAGRRRLTFQPPWSEFKLDVKKAIDGIEVSHRPMRRLAGPLHQETLYSAPRKGADGKGEEVRYRVPVTGFGSEKELENIVDGRVREAVSVWLEGRQEKREQGPRWPELVTRTGKRVEIRKVRIRKAQSVVQVAGGDARRVRYVIPGGNHHMEVIAVDDGEGGVKRYEHVTVTRLEAAQRLKEKRRVVEREQGQGRRFVCSLSEGDLVEAKREGDGQKRVWRVRSVDVNGRFALSAANDARLKADIDKAKGLWRPPVNVLFRARARKVLVDPVGRVIPAND